MGGGPPQPFTAPAVRPATMRLWNSRTMMTMGTVTTIAAAAMAPVGTWNVEAPGNCDSAAGTVCAFFVEVSEKAKTKSFHAKMNTRIAVVNTPGAASGAMTLVKGWEGGGPPPLPPRPGP